MGTAAPAVMPTEDLEAAIAELPAKEDALREAFDCLAACSPYPLPFTWEDLDAHVSSVQSSISRRFSQLRALEAARPARISKNNEGANEVGEEEEEVEEEEEEVEEEDEEEVVVEEEEEEEEEEVEEEEEEEEVVEEEEEEGEAEEEEEEADKQMQGADGYIGNEAKDAKEGGEDDKRDADEEAVTTKASAGQGKEAEGEEELDGYAQWDGEEQDAKEDEMVEKVTEKQFRGLTAGGRKEFAEACERMDAGTLVEFLICVSVNKKLLLALRHAPDPAALVLQVVKLLLSSKDFKYSRVWGKCIRLFRWLSMNSVKQSADTTEQAKLVAKDWKEMIGRPECCGELDSLARGLLQFLISYNIVSEFNIHEIISIFAMVPSKGQQKKINTDNFKLCEDLGLANRATDLIDYMIGNGQHLEVFHVLQIFDLEDKYPPFSLLKGYIEKAKQTSVELFRKNETQKTLNLAIPKEIWIAHQLAEKKLADSRQRSAILAEIRYLIGAYKKNQRSGNPSTPSTWDSQHQPTKCKKRNKKRKKEELEHHEAQVNQQPQAQNKNKSIQGKQHQLHQQENKAQVTEQQQQQQPPRPATVKLPTPTVPLVLNVAQTQNFGRPPYAAMPRVHNYLAQPGWPVDQGMPFVPQFRSPQYMGLQCNPFALHPPSYPR